MPTVQEMREQRAKLVKDSRDIIDLAEKESRAMTTEENQKFDAIDADVEKLSAQIATAERGERARSREKELEERGGRRTDPQILPGHEREYFKPEAVRLRELRSTKEYNDEFRSWFINPHGEYRALQMGVDTQGGYVVPPQQFVSNLIKFVDNLVFIRQYATKYNVPNAQSLGAPSLDNDPEDGDWTTELATGQESVAMTFGKRELYPHPVAKRIKVSNKMLQATPNMQFSGSGFSVGNFGSQPDNLPGLPGYQAAGGSGAGVQGTPGVGAPGGASTFTSGGPEALVRWRLAYKFAVTEEKAFLLGTGAQQALGMFTASNNGIDTSRDVNTGNTTTAIQADNLFEAYYTLKPQYQNRATWIFHRTTIKAIRKLKDGTGQYLWQPGIQAGQPDVILTRPYIQSEYAPNTYTTGQYVGLLGDLSFYWIADAEQMVVQRLNELYAEQNLVGFIGRLETDGMPVLAEAFVRLALA